MKEQAYRVILNGTIADGADRDRVIEKLAAAFKKDTRTVAKLMAAAPRSIRGGLDLATARKYQAILERIGADSHIEEEVLSRAAVPNEPEQAPVMRAAAPAPRAEEPDRRETPVPAHPTYPIKPAKPVAPEPVKETDAAPSTATACPKCGYTPTSPEDVLLVRGDCPKCGLRVRHDLVIEEEENLEAEYRRRIARPESIYRDRTPASWDRKSAASLHTFGLFLAVHAGLVLLWIFLFVPVNALPTHAETLFLQAALLDWPDLLVCEAIVVVAFVVPLFNRGLSWGQRITGIDVLYTEETRIGGLYMSLALRAAVAATVSLGPGWLVLAILSWWGRSVGLWPTAAIMFAGAIVGWLTAWIYTYSRPDSRSLADLAAGTIQVEETPMPRGVSRNAWLMILAVAGCWLLLAGVIPLAARLVRAYWH